MIRNIVFDMGQVLIHFYPEMFFDRMGVPEADRPILEREMFRSVEWTQTDRGTLDETGAVEAFCAKLPQRLHGYVKTMVCDWWKEPLSPVAGMAELLRELKELGYGVYLLSNASSRLHDYFPRIPGNEYFDGKIVSADWKQLKPEREIFQTLFREFSLEPEECFFVDDLPQNVEAARFAGMGGTIFRDDVPRLRRELNAAGVPVKV